MARQTNFSGGELSPLLWGRTDLPVFGNGLRSTLNFFISKQGAAVSRPGTTYVNATKNAPSPRSIFTEGGPGAPKNLPYFGFDPVRLVPFNVADDESFCLELGVGYIRFHTLGATVLSPPIAPAVVGLPYEVATPYTMDDLLALKWAQIGEVLTLCCPNHDPFELRHIADAPATWSFKKAVTAPLDSWFLDINNPGVPTTEPMVLSVTIGTPDADHPARPWEWKVTALVRNDRTHQVSETKAREIFLQYNGADVGTATGLGVNAPGYGIPVYPDMHVVLRRQGPVGALPVFPGDSYTVEAYCFYRGIGAVFGFIGTSTGLDFIDVGDTPNYAIQPPQGTSPFGPVDNAYVPDVHIQPPFDDGGNPESRHLARPSAVCYFEQRRLFAGLTQPEREAEVVASASGDFNNFDKHNVIDVSGEALYATLAATRRGAIRHLSVVNRRVLALAACSSYGFGGVQGSPLDFDSIDAPHIEDVGASDVPPVVVDGACLFVRPLGRGVHALVPGQQEAAAFQGADISQQSEHLFRGLLSAVVDWTYAQEPWGLVWVVRADGRLLSLTLDRNRQMVAWTQHQLGAEDLTADSLPLDGAFVQSVCAVREGDEDAVYLVVIRQGDSARYVERMTSRHLRGGAVPGDQGPYGSAPGLTIPPDNICLDSAQAYVGAPAQVFTGLEHLEGRTVYVLAQNLPVYGPFIVTGGQIDAGTVLPVNAQGLGTAAVPSGQFLVCYIGLLYQPQLELLDIAGGEARLKQKQVTHVGFEVDNTKGISTGQDFDHLTMAPSRTPAIGFGPPGLATGVVLQAVKGTFDLSARAVLRQTLPLPVTVVGISRRIAGGDDP